MTLISTHMTLNNVDAGEMRGNRVRQEQGELLAREEGFIQNDLTCSSAMPRWNFFEAMRDGGWSRLRLLTVFN